MKSGNEKCKMKTANEKGNLKWAQMFVLLLELLLMLIWLLLSNCLQRIQW